MKQTLALLLLCWAAQTNGLIAEEWSSTSNPTPPISSPGEDPVPLPLVKPAPGELIFSAPEPDTNPYPAWAFYIPKLAWQSEWEPTTGGFGFTRTDLSLGIPTYPIYGPPPPMITPSFSITTLDSPDHLGLPSNLYNLSLGLSWMRKINDRWMWRFAFTPTFASDFENTSGDAWRFSALALALWQCTDTWTLGFGAVATGREDLPVLPAVGATWTPSPYCKVDLFFPRPRLSYQLWEHGKRQSWIYLGGGLGGGTWAFQRPGGENDVLTYRDWRLLIGLEFTPAGARWDPRSRGWRGFLEAGYVFGRRLEFDNDIPDFNPNNTALLSLGLSY